MSGSQVAQAFEGSMPIVDSRPGKMTSGLFVLFHRYVDPDLVLPVPNEPPKCIFHYIL